MSEINKICQSCGKKYVPTGNYQKYCSDCQKEKHKECIKKWHLVHPDRVHANQEKWRRTHLDRARESARKWYHTHPEIAQRYYEEHSEEIKEKVRKWNFVHPDQVREKLRKWYQAHLDKERERIRKWYQAHPEAAYTNGVRRRIRLENATIEKINPLKIYKRDNWVCQICGEKVNPKLRYPNPMSASLDHIIPLSKGGTHETKNVQLAHLICNLRKGIKNEKLNNEIKN
jgi:hypothetical protein